MVEIALNLNIKVGSPTDSKAFSGIRYPIHADSYPLVNFCIITANHNFIAGKLTFFVYGHGFKFANCRSHYQRLDPRILDFDPSYVGPSSSWFRVYFFWRNLSLHPAQVLPCLSKTPPLLRSTPKILPLNMVVKPKIISEKIHFLSLSWIFRIFQIPSLVGFIEGLVLLALKINR